ncbi:MAG TPA: pyrimidine 5'-nucleotidase, partial [Gammaproteobacteria bacterium]|nr:pyrimidine 5'-nucleotidase [Gammaproteobacteria bacterium]
MKPMKAYEWILFDIDETLFHFDSFSGLKLALTRLGFEFSQPDFEAYETINKSLWVDYQNCKITSQQLQYDRFKSWAAKLQIPADHLIEAFQNAMAEITKPLDGAIPLLNALRGKTKLGVITNGFTYMQHARLERTGLKDHFDVV